MNLSLLLGLAPLLAKIAPLIDKVDEIVAVAAPLAETVDPSLAKPIAEAQAILADIKGFKL